MTTEGLLHCGTIARKADRLRRVAGPVLACVVTTLALSGCSSPPAPVVPEHHRIVIIGDSLSTGYGTSPADAWPNLINNDPAFHQGRPDLINAAQNGSGYVSVGDNNSTFGTQVTEMVTAETRLVVFFGSENDIGVPPAQIGAAASQAFETVKNIAPQAAILVVGPPSYTHNPEPERVQVRDQDRTAALQAGAQFVDPIADGWIMDNAAELIGPDGDHPSTAGQHFLQTQMERLIAPLIPQNPVSAPPTPTR
ncbi:SGNH/GDSL hydrolase family protein [Paeniglutamicibacter antarcticus]|uniref:SGNH/GDSL hydrolase family protein n=1 Tax=Arthrobacter terrae TaxID=2935737 RepID=A0A931G8N5_9MICC|nr:SGNH/GDSL hydrolase family protein [Arthrobacter terrae]MBG0740384.1 SGNH/GDSL hydrolase family protein [Arthrobacter terrae]